MLQSDSEIENKIKNIFLQVFPNLNENDFSFEKEQKDYENWDSFAQLNLITFAEAEFNISFSLDESIEIKSARQFVNNIKSHLK